MITQMKKYKLIGEKIKKVREAAGISQKKLAKAIGFETATSISLIESGSRRVATRDLEKIADILHTDIKFFLGQKTDKANIRFALRADKELSATDKDKILDFIDFVKRRKNARRKQ
jgi:transcriptional regulator with XRE-family HTH domain